MGKEGTPQRIVTRHSSTMALMSGKKLVCLRVSSVWPTRRTSQCLNDPVPRTPRL
jgi:hypothetical protein